MDDKVNLKMVQLSTTDQEYKDVTTKFKATAGGVNVEFVKVIIHDFSIFPLIFPYMWSYPFSARVSQYITHDNIYYQVTSVIQIYYRQFLKWHHITEPFLINILLLISYAWNDGLLIASHISGFTFHAILLWEIHSSKTNLFKL